MTAIYRRSTLRRCRLRGHRARKEIIIPGGRTPRRINHALMLAIARAKTWMQHLRDGKYRDTVEIARRFELNDAMSAGCCGWAISRLTSSKPLSKAASRVP